MVTEKIAVARESADVLVGVHLRQGDYKNFVGGMMYFETREYTNLMQKTEEMLSGKKVAFLICSDVPQDPAEFQAFNWVSGSGHEAADMFSLAECNYLIGPQSTFTQWASWFGQVPRFVYNRKFEQQYELDVTMPQPKSFIIHDIGFGKFDS